MIEWMELPWGWIWFAIWELLAVGFMWLQAAAEIDHE